MGVDDGLAHRKAHLQHGTRTPCNEPCRETARLAATTHPTKVTVGEPGPGARLAAAISGGNMKETGPSRVSVSWIPAFISSKLPIRDKA